MASDQSGRVTAFSVILILIIIIVIYEFGVIYGDWSHIRLIPVKITVNNDLRFPIAGAAITIDEDYIGQTDEAGQLTAFLSELGRIHILARKKPFNDVDTTISLESDPLNISLSMHRPYSALTVAVLDESGEPLDDVAIESKEENIGKTGEDGKFTASESFRILDSIYVKLSKKGYKDLSQDILLSELEQTASFTMVKGTAPPPVTKPPVSPPKPDFQTHFDLANRYLDRAISGESKYFGRALNEIDRAIAIRPRYQLAKQLKVEILFNFAKSLRDSNLLYEAANRCGEALKVYQEIPQDQMFYEVQKLKAEVDEKLN